MKYLYIAFLSLLTGCVVSPNINTDSAPPTPLRPKIIAPVTGSEFISSNLMLEWDWSDLDENQVFVLRLWYENLEPREVWLVDEMVNAREFIDSYSQSVGNFYWKVAVINTDTDGQFSSMASDWSQLQTLKRVRQFTIDPLPKDQMSETATFIAAHNFDSIQELIDFTREWMYANTKLGDELDDYLPDYSDAAQKMFNHFMGSGEAPQMWCNGISTTMHSVLKELGIDSRLVFLYGEVPGWISQHTVLEVFNPETQTWQVQDPTYNRYFVDRTTREIAPIDRLVFDSLKDILVCSNGICRRDSELEGARNLLGGFRYGYTAEIFINPDRLNISRRVQAFNDENFTEFIAREIGLPVSEITFRFDSLPPVK